MGSADQELLDLFAMSAAGPASSSAGGPAPAERREAVYSVSAVNRLVRQLLEEAIPPLWVSGEVTNWKRHTSGHCYFSLRDASAQLRCVMFRSDAQRLPADPEEGMKVRALGGLTIYEARGSYQLVVRELEGEGAGGLWRVAFEKLRAKLDAEGLLAAERKRPVPAFPARVGVVTSPVGAALQDILHGVERRAPWTRVVLCAAQVQGEGAAAEVASAIERLAAHGDVDVIIVGRGGGSVEDLWAFNEEVVARAIAASPVPVVSAVGHEVDVTIADLVADRRAPTPSAAAELAVPSREELLRRLDGAGRRLAVGLERAAEVRRRRLERLRERMGNAVQERIRSLRERVSRLGGKLEGLSPLSALERGYSVALAEDGSVLKRVGDLPAGRRFRLRVADGVVPCRVDAGDTGRSDDGDDEG